MFVAMDPVLDGFEGVFVELVRVGEGSVLRHTAAVSGNRFVEIDLSSEYLALALFEAHNRMCGPELLTPAPAFRFHASVGLS